MKNKILNFIKSSVLLCAMTATLSSCNDFLDREPYGVTEAVFFSTAGDFEAYAIGRYGMLGPVAGGYNIGNERLADNNTDNQFTQGAANRWQNLVRVGNATNQWSFGNLYTINYFFQYALPKYNAGTVQGASTTVEQAIGEMYFFRAYWYFDRLKTLGDMPIVYRNLPDDKDMLIAASVRQPRNEVARMILADLDSAAHFLNESPAGGKNRLSKMVAHLFKSRVALYEGTFEKNFAGTAFVPNGTGWPGIKSHPSYSYNNASEVQFFLQTAMSEAKIVADAYTLVSSPATYDYKKNNAMGNNPYYDMFASPENGLDNCPEVLLYKRYSATETVTHFSSGYLANGGATGFTDQFMSTFLMRNGLPIYAAGSGYAAANYDSIAQIKIDRDSRLQIFLKAGGEQNTNNPSRLEPRAPVILDIGEQRATTGYSMKKGLPADDTESSGGGSPSLTGSILFRAAEAYLNYIEACIELNGSVDGTADTYWKAIRNRVNVDPNYNATIAATNMSMEAPNDWGAYTAGTLVSALRYNIRRERRCEFMAEGFRWDDLVRWRALDQITETNKWEPKGFRLWNGFYNTQCYLDDTGTTLLIAPPAPAGKNANVSAPSKGINFYPLAINQTNNPVLDGIWFLPANYLLPIANSHFLNSSTTGNPDDSPIYQNPGWTTEANSLPGSVGGF